MSFLTDISDSHGDGTLVVRCPQCGYLYSHVREAGTLLGGDEGGVYLGTNVLGTVANRRSAITILFDGECGHSWEWRIQQHKGQNFFLVNEILPHELPD